jgi:uncharacterized protein (DUF983 family)
MKAAICGALVALSVVGVEIALGLDLELWQRLLIVCPLTVIVGLTSGGAK